MDFQKIWFVDRKSRQHKRAIMKNTVRQVAVLLCLFFQLAPALLMRGRSSNICGEASDPCMNDENLAHCRDIEKGGCQNLQVVPSSCPRQFYCHDDDEVSPAPDACVSLAVFEQDDCEGKQLHVISIPTWSSPGSPCCKLCDFWFWCCASLSKLLLVNYGLLDSLFFIVWNILSLDHDSTLRHVSLKDQYCNFDTGLWHQTLYWPSEKCREKKMWWRDVKPLKLVYTTDSCVFGLQLVSCKKGSCENHTTLDYKTIE
jgi:hypothetical protein